VGLRSPPVEARAGRTAAPLEVGRPTHDPVALTHPGPGATAGGHRFAGLDLTASGEPPDRVGAVLPAAGELAGAPFVRSSPLADRYGVAGAAADGAVHLSSDAERLSLTALRRILAHEAIHLAQRRAAGARSGSRSEVELEAGDLTPELLAGRPVRPRFRWEGAGPLLDTPVERMAVERARRRVEILRRFLDEWALREARRLSIASERDPLLARRARIDAPVPAPVGALEPGRIAALNRRPLAIEVTETDVRFRVRFHVRFEGLGDEEARRRFGALQSSFLAGLDLVWNQRLTGLELGGRRFEIVPEMTLVSARSPRDQGHWLITVRPADDAPMAYEGQSMGTSPGGLPTSVTDPTLDGGVMSIPPSHATKPGVLGHEVLHLFGLLDRYLAVTSAPRAGAQVHETVSLRETGGRRDPLAAEDARILPEDLTFLFERLGVYELEAGRGLDTLRALQEGERLDRGLVVAELHRQEEIIRLGQDPRSLIPERRDFRDKVLRSVEDL
jgi:hypothetical protein